MATRRILLIDDERDLCDIVKMGLEMLGGYVVEVAYSGKDGIKLAKKKRPDLILLDIIMPGLDGLEVLKRLKKDRATFAIPVIMVTAKTDDESKEMASQLYGEMYITKPVDVAVLKARIDEVLKVRGGK